MTVDLEQTLLRELREVADGLTIPPLPPRPASEPSRHSRRWVPVVAAAAAVVVAGAAAFALSRHDDSSVQPAPSPTPPSPTATTAAETLPRSEPTIPYVVDRSLHVGGHRVPGRWYAVEAGPSGWIGWHPDNTWWWASGTQTDPQQIPLSVDKPPVISPNGLYVAQLSSDNGGSLTGFDTRPAGEGLGSVPIDLGDQQQGSAVSVRAVLDDGRVIAQGTDTAVLWRPLVDNRTIDLTRTAPGQVFLAATPAGLVVADGEDGPTYLADLDDDGTLHHLADLPDHDDLAVSTQGTWLVWTPLGTTQGDVFAVPTLQARELTGTEPVTITAPDGYAFTAGRWAWEDDDHLVATIVDEQGERMTRCVLPSARCVVLPAT